jgi:hypothetical protein
MSTPRDGSDAEDVATGDEPTASTDEATTEDTGTDTDTDGDTRGVDHLADAPDGCGCVEVWEHASEHESGTAAE